MPTGAPVKMAAPAQLQAEEAWAADETERFIIYVYRALPGCQFSGSCRAVQDNFKCGHRATKLLLL